MHPPQACGVLRQRSGAGRRPGGAAKGAGRLPEHPATRPSPPAAPPWPSCGPPALWLRRRARRCAALAARRGPGSARRGGPGRPAGAGRTSAGRDAGPASAAPWPPFAPCFLAFLSAPPRPPPVGAPPLRAWPFWEPEPFLPPLPPPWAPLPPFFEPCSSRLRRPPRLPASACAWTATPRSSQAGPCRRPPPSWSGAGAACASSLPEPAEPPPVPAPEPEPLPCAAAALRAALASRPRAAHGLRVGQLVGPGRAARWRRWSSRPPRRSPA